MRTLARAATRSLISAFRCARAGGVRVAAIGILGTRSATHQGNAISGDELTTAIVTNQLARNIDAAYATGEQAALTTQPATRSRLLGSLNTSLLPAVDAELFVAGTAARRRLRRPSTPTSSCSSGSGPPSVTCSARPTVTAAPAGALAAQLTAAYQPVSAHLDRLILKELDDANTDHAQASAAAAQATGMSLGFGVARPRDRPAVPVARVPAHPPEPRARPGPGGVRRYAAARERRGRDAPAPAAPPRAHAAGHRGRGAQPEQQRGPAGGGHAPAARLAAGRDPARCGAALVPGGAVGPDAPRERRAAALLSCSLCAPLPAPRRASRSRSAVR